MTLTEFLLARIADDLAQASGVGDVNTYAFVGDKPGVVLSGDRWRAECEAKRRIVMEHDPHTDPCSGTFGGLACPTLRDFAAIYSHHPDYRDEWRPAFRWVTR